MLQSEEHASQDEAVEALIALGYSSNDAIRALHSIDTSLSTEDRVKQALQGDNK